MYPSLTSEETQLTLEKIMILIEKQKEQGEIEVNNLEETDEEKDINEN
jgi:hypothetical protein